MGKNLKKLEKIAGPAGIEVGGLVSEIADEVIKRLPPPIDPAVLLEQTVERVSALVAHKLSEVTESISGKIDAGAIDQSGLIKGVAELLQPNLKAAGDRAATEAIAAAKQAVEQVKADLEARLPKVPEDGAVVAAGSSASSWGGMVRENKEFILEVVKLFRPQQSADEKIVDEGLRLMRLTDSLIRMRDGERDRGKLLQALGPATPAPGA